MNVASNSGFFWREEGQQYILPQKNLDVSAVGDTHFSELVSGVPSKKKMGNFGLEHSLVCFEADVAGVQEEVEIALHKLLESMESNVLVLPQPVPVEM